MNLRRTGIIFRKELIDILRDRRTLIAMILVPIVLYPLLILGSSQAVQFQTGRMQREEFFIGVPDEETGQRLHVILQQELAVQDGALSRPASPPSPALPPKTPPPELRGDDALRQYKLFVEPDPRRAVQEGRVQVALIARETPAGWDRWEVDPPFFLVYDSAEVRSEMARARLERVLERRRAAIRDERIDRLPGEQRELFRSTLIPVTNVASPRKMGGSLLGQILPFILVVMTITGAVYPAIDLTAGERERGTLETLMVAPVPVIEMIAGKFLVVTVVSLMAAALNVVSIGVSLLFGNLREQVLGGGNEVQIPMAVFPLIIASMVPFAVLFSAVLIAVASFARTFKEAQNYMTPVIMAALIPATAGAIPGVELRGAMTVMPVTNMVLLTREMLLGHFHNWPAMLLALGSTCFYAVVAVIVAARLFGQEAVLFADAGSWKTLFRRSLFVSQPAPSPTHVLLFLAVLFPVWFHIQGQVGARIGVSVVLIAVFFGLAPLALARYLKISLCSAFALRPAKVGHWLGAVAVGLGSWALAYEVLVVQSRILPVPEGMRDMNDALERSLAGWPFPVLLLAMGVLPGVSEELMFRGFVLSGLRTKLRPAAAIVASSLLFAAFHFLLIRFGVTAALGVVLGYACWRTGSIGPSMVIHAMHNSILVALPRSGGVAAALGAANLDGATHLPNRVIAGAALLVGFGLVLLSSRRGADRAVETPAPGDGS